MAQSKTSNPLTLQLTIEDSTKATESHLILKATLTNQSEKPIRIYGIAGMRPKEHAFSPWYCLVMHDGQAYRDPSTPGSIFCSPRDLKKSDRQTIRSHHSKTIFFDLHEWYPIRQPGIYEVRAVFESKEIPKLKIKSSAAVISNSITIEIK